MSVETKLSRHDKRLLGAVIAFTLGHAQAGAVGAASLRAISEARPDAGDTIKGALLMLGATREGMSLDDMAKPSYDAFKANLARLQELGLLLLDEDAQEVDGV